MSGGRANVLKRGLEYYTENPWNGEGDDHEDWLEVLALEALTLGGQPLREWIRGEGWDIDVVTPHHYYLVSIDSVMLEYLFTRMH